MFTEVQLEAKNARERHLIASYQGRRRDGGPTAAYVTSWFPNAGLFSPEVGTWVSSEVWRPDSLSGASNINDPARAACR